MLGRKRKTHKPFQTVRMIPSAQVLILFLVLAFPVHAHRVYVFAWVEGDTVYTESYFSDKKVVDGVIKVFDPSGVLLLQGKTNDKGEFSFLIPKKIDLRIVLEATMGHKAEYLLKAEDLPDLSERPGPSSSSIELDMEQIRILVEEALDSRLKPITKALNRIEQERGPGLTEIIGGIGYIFGIMGLILYFRSRKNR